MSWQNLVAPSVCRLCGGGLTPLQRMRGDVCDAIGCRRAAVEERVARERDTELRRRQRRAGAAGLPAAPVIWLVPNRNRLVATSAAERADQRAHLARLAQEPSTPGPATGDEAQAELAAPAAPIEGRLCAFCGGNCCRFGRSRHAFVSRAMLERWVRRHPGSTLEDAAADYEARLPSRHVEASCLHHGREGCTLPREMRSDICNRHVCAGLARAQTPGVDALVAVMAQGAHLLRASAIDEQGEHPLRSR